MNKIIKVSILSVMLFFATAFFINNNADASYRYHSGNGTIYSSWYWTRTYNSYTGQFKYKSLKLYFRGGCPNYTKVDGVWYRQFGLCVPS